MVANMIDVLSETYSDAPAFAQAIVECTKTNQLDEAEALLERMHDAYPATREVLVFEVTIALMRGRPHDAWQIVNGLPDESCPELKALCLRMLDDPSWYSYAVAHEDSPNPHVREAMRHLLGRPMASESDAAVS
jgi:type III secretion protein HrpB1